MVGQATHSNLNRTTTEHLVQLFDTDESLVDGVAQFLREGLTRNEQMLVIMDEQRWYAVAMRLSSLGWPSDEAVRFGQLIVRNVKETLNKFMVGDRPHPQLFAASVGTLVSGLAACGKPLRVYGEMVDVLAGRGQYAAACELEELWNELGRRRRFTLLCGYMAGHFGDPRNAGDLLRICTAHSGARSAPEDVLGSFLMSRYSAV
jgi:MEDS: MEthanogen/methylotroph, DcmR Sensory domain